MTRIAFYGDMGIYSWNAMGGLLNDSTAGVNRDKGQHRSATMDDDKIDHVQEHTRVDCIVHMGDHAYNYGDANGTRADAYLDGYSPVLSATPWVPVVGNHEGYDSFYFFFNETDGENSEVDPATTVAHVANGTTSTNRRSRLPHPMTTIMRTGVGQFGAGAESAPRSGSGTPRWFSLQIGIVHLVALDCMVNWAPPSSVHNQTDPDAAAMLSWLDMDLAAVDRATTPWVVVVSHYPIFCSGCLTGTPPGMPAALEPLFIEHGVDLYAAGHWHYYESLWPSVSTNGPYGT